jgi:hypothetical protein
MSKSQRTPKIPLPKGWKKPVQSAVLDVDDQTRRYLEWRQDGKYSVNGRCFDIGGTTTRAALIRVNPGSLPSGEKDWLRKA